ncbi:ABC transporter permease [Streptomyces sp. CRN 30]|uniref:ABC transporter permease n=1 Tax=Streptomyces sp. CRN 30 TaxID=3075613 RepID=UPI002A815260|nr:ABC transporter permease [Streptomyces sp. CRN 30]
MTAWPLQLTGTRVLAGFVLRRERVRVAVWTTAVPLLVLLTAASVKGLYPTQHDLDVAARASEDNAASIAFNGPPLALDTLGGEVAFQTGSLGLVLVALMTLFTVGRQTRGEEEAGRAELVRSMAVGRHANAAAALIVAVAMNVVVGVLLTAGLIAMDLPVSGSAVFGASFCALGLVFAGATTVLAQISENTRVVHGGAGALLGLAFLLRAVGDIGDGTVSWLSPLGWVQKARPYAGERWWPLLIAAGCAVATVVVAAVLAGRRDLGAGLVAPRPGPERAAPALGRPLGLARRLQRGALLGWSCAVFLAGAAYGWVADDVEDFVSDNDTMRDIITGYGGADLTDAYLSRSLLTVALLGAGFAVQSALLPRGEETALRAEPVLATPVSRRRWVGSHLMVAMGGSVVVLVSAGLGTGVTYAAVSRDAGQIPRLLGAALAYAPALWVLAGLATALYGLLPRAVVGAWALFALCLLAGLLGEVLGLPERVTGLSPFEHVPHLPAEEFTVVPLLVLTLLAAGLTAVGQAGFRGRDVG